MASYSGPNPNVAVSTWECWECSKEGELTKTHQTATYDSVLRDVVLNKDFRFICESHIPINGVQFKGYYVNEPKLTVHRNPRHLRQLTDAEKNEHSSPTSNSESVSVRSSNNSLRGGSASSKSPHDSVRDDSSDGSYRHNSHPSNDSEDNREEIFSARAMELQEASDGCSSLKHLTPSPKRRRHREIVVADTQQQRQRDKETKNFFPCTLEQIQRFAVERNTTLSHLKRVAKDLGLRITQGSRGRRSYDGLWERIAFGLKTRVVVTLRKKQKEVKLHLFKYSLHLRTGFYEPSMFYVDFIRYRLTSSVPSTNLGMMCS